MTVAAIMQPTYLPWAGYLAMIEKVDIFVFLDSVQFARRSWQQRNRIKSANGELMLTVPVHRKGLRDQKIQNVRIEREAGFANKHIAAIDMNYRGSAAFDAASPELYDPVNGHEKLCDLSLDVIGWLYGELGCKTRQCGSQRATEERRAASVVCREIGADTYLSAPASQIPGCITASPGRVSRSNITNTIIRFTRNCTAPSCLRFRRSICSLTAVRRFARHCCPDCRDKALCVIPARGGSKGIPSKNTMAFAGIPMICHSLGTATSPMGWEIHVSTGKEIVAVAEEAGRKPDFQRPQNWRMIIRRSSRW